MKYEQLIFLTNLCMLLEESQNNINGFEAYN